MGERGWGGVVSVWMAAVAIAGCSSNNGVGVDARSAPDGPLAAGVDAASFVDALPMPDAGPPAPLTLYVDGLAAPGGDGSAAMPFQEPQAALAAARLAAAATPQLSITVRVRPGGYTLSAPLLLDVTGLQLIGSNVPDLDDGGLPLGTLGVGSETRLVADPAWDINAPRQDPDGVPALTDPSLIHLAADDLTVEDLTLDAAGVSGGGIDAARAQGFVVSDVIFAGGGTGFEGAASSGTVSTCYAANDSVGMLLGAGNADHPATVRVDHNRVVGNDTGGVLVNGSGTSLAGLYDTIGATISDNDLSGHVSGPASFGVRLFLTRRDAPDPENQASGHVVATLSGNTITGNQFGVIVDAGFPFRTAGTPPVCDPRVFSGTIDVSLGGDTISGSLTAPALIATTRSSAALKPSTLSSWQYLHGATFTIVDPNGELTGAKIEHPTDDRYLGDCPADQVGESLGNTLTIAGVTVPNQTIAPLP